MYKKFNVSLGIEIEDTEDDFALFFLGKVLDRPGIHRHDVNDLCANGEDPICALPRAGSRIRPPRMLGVWAQKAQM